MILLLTALAGGIGGVARFTVDSQVAARNRMSVPMGTFVVNATACFLLGLLTGWVAHVSGTADVKAVLGVGLMGGYSTVSTASVEGIRLVGAGRPVGALAHAAGMLALSVIAASLGMLLGDAIG